jgi:hypothetical protein
MKQTIAVGSGKLLPIEGGISLNRAADVDMCFGLPSVARWIAHFSYKMSKRLLLLRRV